MTDKIALSYEPPIALLRLNRPEKLNALDVEMLDGLEVAVRELENDPSVRVVVLAAAGDRAFCVGADINAWGALEPLDMWRQWTRMGHRVFNRLAGLPQPVLAVLNGYTFGGGLELALAADLRLAADTISLALPEVTIGTLPGWGGTHRLAQLIGIPRTKQLIFTGDRISAKQALQWGLVNDTFPAATLWDEALNMARRIAQNAPLSVQFAKEAIDHAYPVPRVALEALSGALAAHSEDGAEGLRAFSERRPPQFQGK